MSTIHHYQEHDRMDPVVKELLWSYLDHSGQGAPCEEGGRSDVDLRKLLVYHLNHWKTILLSGLVLAMLAFAVTFFWITPQYRASVSIYVNNTTSSQSVDAITGSNLSAAQQLVNTYISIIQSNTVLKDVIEAGELDCQPKDLLEIMTAEQINDTEMFRVSILHPDAQMAQHIAETIATVAPDKISEFVEGSSTKIIDHAEEPLEPYSPRYPIVLAISAVVGCVLAVLFLTLRYLFDMHLTDEEDIREYFNAPVLASIPEFDQTGRGGRRHGYAAYTRERGE